jgi:hypothetical protein
MASDSGEMLLKLPRVAEGMLLVRMPAPKISGISGSSAARSSSSRL